MISLSLETLPSTSAARHLRVLPAIAPVRVGDHVFLVQLNVSLQHSKPSPAAQAQGRERVSKQPRAL